MPGTPDANLRDQYSHPACLMTSRRTGEGPYHAVTVDVPEAPAGVPRETVGETPLELRSDSAPSRTSGLAARSSVVKSPEISRSSSVLTTSPPFRGIIYDHAHTMIFWP
jgi:hypothetical protein